ncbi:ADAMTS-like protein 1 [Aplysia californica]|uniref:ADAMTS-like protein 1 n=1 Tax=Aplysia californica TaxID=6500 RepID=A0ABM1W1G6_APLCA|nr:ADAMTS-like protein 1 [Aplysia californica]
MKRQLCVLVGILLTVVTPTLSDHWSQWSVWSECSRTCDGGATYQERKCVRSYETRRGCDGERFRYNTCNNEPCSPDSFDFRSQQCAAYNNATYGGKLYTWLPYTDRKNPCTLYCIPKGTRTVVRLAPKVLDGTRCKFNAHDMCISGKCWKVGCDHRLDSPMTLDLCGVCGGNNSCLNNGTKGRYHWVEIGLSPCSASCGVGSQTYQYRCRDRLTGNQVPDGRCVRSPKPNGRQKSCFRRQCPPVWKIFSWQACSVSCGGGVATRAVRCMDTLRDGRQQWLHDSFCPHPKPSGTRPCNSHICPRWYAGEWSPCSVTCGWGEQVREVVCRHEGDKFCDVITKPVTRRNCTTIFPCTDPDDPRYIAEHDDNGRQELSFGPRRDVGDEMALIHEDDVENHDMSTPRYVVSSWSECSATCGQGFRQRYVRCQVHLVYLQDMVDLADSECSDRKPPANEVCSLEPCYDNFQWVAQGMTPCSRSCLGGTQETQLECTHKTTGKAVPEDHCLHAEKIRVDRRICNDFPCPQRWRIGDFGECSTTCGGGIMIRDVRCIQQVDIALDRVLNLPDVMCEQPIPQRVRECNTQLCPANWASGFWSQCSVTCGAGVQLRPVVCQRVTPDGEPVDVDEYHCPPSERPESDRPCNLTACPEVRIKQKKMKFFQVNKLDKVRLVVGAEAAVLPGTSIIMRCPVRGMSKRRLEWLKNDRPVRKGRRVTISNRGNLRIRRSRPDKDTGVYTCIADTKKASVTIVFSALYDILQETLQREKYLLGILADESRTNTTATLKDPFDKKLRPLQLVVANWSACTATCGGGVRKRKVTCEIITNNYFETFPLRTCKHANIAIPDSIEKCATDPCTRWVTKDWSQCLEENCAREGFSSKVRTVSCVMESNTSVVADRLCNETLQPLSRKECRNPLCRPVWNTSQWSECLANCGESGFQTRMLTCIWEGNRQPAGRHCEGMGRPVLTRPCFNNCTHECVDNSDYCSIVPMMKLCRFTNFKTKCCHSCKSLPEDPPS